MKILRWLFFLPIGFVLMGIAQFAVAFVAERTSFWVGAPLILFFGVLIVAASMIPCRIAPNPKVGAAILLTLFVLFELLSSIPSCRQRTSSPLSPVCTLT